ncbi:hypothetical protein PRIC1_005755 [Phytophthora ramorum]
MAQLRRLRELFDAQERVFTTVPGLADYVTQLEPSRGSTCAIRMCFLRDSHFTTDQYSGTHLEFIDAESASVFDNARSMLLAIPLNQARSEICRLTVWERTDLTNFTLGVVYEIRHVFNLNLYAKMPQGSAMRVCAEGRLEVKQPNVANDATPASNAGTPTAAPASTSASEAAQLDVHTKTTDAVDLAVSATPKRKHPDGPQKAPPKPPSQKKHRAVQ